MLKLSNYILLNSFKFWSLRKMISQKFIAKLKTLFPFWNVDWSKFILTTNITKLWFQIIIAIPNKNLVSSQLRITIIYSIENYFFFYHHFKKDRKSFHLHFFDLLEEFLQFPILFKKLLIIPVFLSSQALILLFELFIEFYYEKIKLIITPIALVFMIYL